jgi:hypothetical protein
VPRSVRGTEAGIGLLEIENWKMEIGKCSALSMDGQFALSIFHFSFSNNMTMCRFFARLTPLFA